MEISSCYLGHLTSKQSKRQRHFSGDPKNDQKSDQYDNQTDQDDALRIHHLSQHLLLINHVHQIEAIGRHVLRQKKLILVHKTNLFHIKRLIFNLLCIGQQLLVVMTYELLTIAGHHDPVAVNNHYVISFTRKAAVKRLEVTLINRNIEQTIPQSCRSLL
ncbi:hypothetical protein D3C74_295150 [compost metagenome]